MSSSSVSSPTVPSPLVLLGPQRLEPSVGAVYDELGLHGSVAAITAGWEEREEEVEELSTHLGRTVSDLRLDARAGEALAEDAELAAAVEARNETVRELRRFYRLRLSGALQTARELLSMRGDPKIVVSERKAAIQAVRAIDQRFLRKMAKAREEFEAEARLAERTSVARHRREIASVLERSESLAIAGGHVAVLLDHLRLFGLGELAMGKPIIAWSAGAMALAERVVLFHDSPPQGAGDAELLDAGLGLFTELIPLPHARRRLRLEDATRVALFARRFGPAWCVTLDEGGRLERQGAPPSPQDLDGLGGDHWKIWPGSRRLTARGRVVEVNTHEH